jgi:Tol biopolymer transport system component
MAPESARVIVFSADGAEARTVPTGRVRPMTARWTPEGRIELDEMLDDGRRRRFIMERDGRDMHEVQPDSIASASSDSSLLLFEARDDGMNSIFATDRRRRAGRQLTKGFWDEQPSLSPRGHAIVFERRADPQRIDLSDVVLMDPSGGNIRVVAPGTDPSWSPDGRKLVFKAPDTTGASWISVWDEAGGSVRRLAPGVHPHWSPDGTRVVYMDHTTRGVAHIRIVDVATGVIRCVTCTPP